MVKTGELGKPECLITVHLEQVRHHHTEFLNDSLFPLLILLYRLPGGQISFRSVDLPAAAVIEAMTIDVRLVTPFFDNFKRLRKYDTHTKLLN